MQGVGCKGLSSAGLTIDQHMSIGLPQIQNVFAQLPHGGRVSSQFLNQLTPIRQLAAQSPIIKRQPPRCSRLTDDRSHIIGVKRLFEKVKRPKTHRLNGHRHITVSSNHHHRQSAITAHQFLQQAQTIHPRHANICDDDAGIIRADNA